jgi:hypothetical protein
MSFSRRAFNLPRQISNSVACEHPALKVAGNAGTGEPQNARDLGALLSLSA